MAFSRLAVPVRLAPHLDQGKGKSLPPCRHEVLPPGKDKASEGRKPALGED